MSLSRLSLQAILTGGVAMAGGLAAAQLGLPHDVVTGLATGVISNFAHDLVEKSGDQVFGRLKSAFSGQELPINHDLAYAVRRAQIEALNYSLQSYWNDKEREFGRGEEAAVRAFKTHLEKWCSNQRKALETRDWIGQLNPNDLKEAQENTSAMLAQPFDKGAAPRLEKNWVIALQSLVREAETSIGRTFPPVFVERLRAEDPTTSSWAQAALAFFSEALKENERLFRTVALEQLGRVNAAWADCRVQLAAIQHRCGDIGSQLTALDAFLRTQLDEQGRTISLLKGHVLELLSLVRSDRTGNALRRAVNGEYVDAGRVAAQVRSLISEKSRMFVGREGPLHQLDAFIHDNESGCMVVAAPSGMGKSSLLAEWVHTRKFTDLCIVRHFCNRRYPATVLPVEILRHLLVQIRAFNDNDDRQIPAEQSRLSDEIFDQLTRLSGIRTLAIVLDGLDEADPGLAPFIEGKLPLGVVLILGVRAENRRNPPVLQPWLDAFGRGGDREPSRLELNGLTVEDAIDWINEAQPNVRHLDERWIAQRLIAATEGFPLFLRFVVPDVLKGSPTQHPSLIGRRRSAVCRWNSMTMSVANWRPWMP